LRSSATSATIGLALGTWHARGRRSGVELHLQQAAWLLHFRNRKLTRLQTFTDPNKALEAAGLPE
jgi:ketosteroid isomerase-like protein